MTEKRRTRREPGAESSVGTAGIPLSLRHRVHDYSSLIRRWRAVARHSGLRMKRFVSESGYDLFYLENPRLAGPNSVYLSAGIHGDEPASTEGLISWAEAHVEHLRTMPLLIFPCLNPWGLVNNCRLDQNGRDLNRMFKETDVPVIEAWKQVVGDRKFSLAVMLHEDYDGTGIYIYELDSVKPYWAEELLKHVAHVLPAETRTKIDGRRARNGLVRRKIRPGMFPMYPEAIYVHLYHCDRVFTIETPSEFSIDQRVQAQVLIVEECIRRLA